MHELNAEFLHLGAHINHIQRCQECISCICGPPCGGCVLVVGATDPEHVTYNVVDRKDVTTVYGTLCPWKKILSTTT